MTNEDLMMEYLAERDVACARCGYSLRGSSGEACPECGWVPQLTVQRDSRGLTAWMCAMVGSGMILLVVISVTLPEIAELVKMSRQSRSMGYLFERLWFDCLWFALIAGLFCVCAGAKHWLARRSKRVLIVFAAAGLALPSALVGGFHLKETLTYVAPPPRQAPSAFDLFGSGPVSSRGSPSQETEAPTR